MMIRLIRIMPLAFCALGLHAQFTAQLASSVPSGQPVGTQVIWTSSVSNATVNPLFRLEYSTGGGSWNLIRDYIAAATLPWTLLQEGNYSVRVTALDPISGATAQAVVPFVFTSRITAGVPVVSPTANPLVFLYSAPACSSGTISVYFRPLNVSGSDSTPALLCQGTGSVNVYMAGLYANSAYLARQVINLDGRSTYGPTITFTTGTSQLSVPPFVIQHPPDSSTSTAEHVLLTSFVSAQGAQPVTPFATDLSGKLLWYYPNVASPTITGAFLWRPIPGGNMALNLTQSGVLFQVLREVDLAGNTVRETNAGAISMQLRAKGLNPINWVSHEAIRFQNGHTLTFGSVEKMLFNVQGSGWVDVVGDIILELDSNLQVVWTWNTFDHLDNTRKATLNDVCTALSCGPLYLASTANDWTHCNSISYVPSDGSLIVSSRHQDWVFKIDYASGAGSGNILWRLGLGGDFSLSSSVTYPWFSHQHDFEFDGTNYGVFDNGNTRLSQVGGKSRGQVLSLNEASRTASLLVNIDLGTYAIAWGSAQLLANGNHQFMAGSTYPVSAGSSQSSEWLPSGTANYSVTWQNNAYRSFRMKRSMRRTTSSRHLRPRILALRALPIPLCPWHGALRMIISAWPRMKSFGTVLQSVPVPRRRIRTPPWPPPLRICTGFRPWMARATFHPRLPRSR